MKVLKKKSKALYCPWSKTPEIVGCVLFITKSWEKSYYIPWPVWEKREDETNGRKARQLRYQSWKEM